MKKGFPRIMFLLPSVIGTLTFFLVPVCYCFIYSFSRTSGRVRYAGAANYVSLHQSEAFRQAMGNTYLLMLVYIGVLMIFSLTIVYFLDASVKKLGMMLVFSLPMLLPPTLIARSIGEFAVSPRMVLLGIFLWKYMGFHVLLLKVMELTMNPEWEEAAVLEHAGKWQVFTQVRCPYLWPYMRFLLVFDVICFFRLFRESYLLYGKYPPDEVYMISNFFFNNFQNLNYQRLSSAAMTALIPVMIMNGILLKAGGKHEMV